MRGHWAPGRHTSGHGPNSGMNSSVRAFVRSHPPHPPTSLTSSQPPHSPSQLTPPGPYPTIRPTPRCRTLRALQQSFTTEKCYLPSQASTPNASNARKFSSNETYIRLTALRQRNFNKVSSSANSSMRHKSKNLSAFSTFEFSNSPKRNGLKTQINQVLVIRPLGEN